MNDKLKFLKKQKKKLLILATCATLAISSGCGKTDNTNSNAVSDTTADYAITYNGDIAVIFKAPNFTRSYDGILDLKTMISSPYILLYNCDEEYAYSVAESIVGEDGTITLFDSRNQLKISK